MRVIAEKLRELLHYDPETGKLWWRERSAANFKSLRDCRAWNTRFSGVEAFTSEVEGYRCGAVFGRMYRAHRVAWALHYGQWPLQEIDHINGNRSDNRLVNLREATPSQNQRNRASARGSSSAFLGVGWVSWRKKWQAQIQDTPERHVFLGYFTDEAEAARAYDKAATARHGAFARLNFPATEARVAE